MTDNPMKIRRVYFQFKVDDLIRAKDFYNKIFDFDIAFFQGVEIGWAEIQLPSEVRLGLNLRLPKEEKKDSLGVLTFEVENLEESREYFVKQGLEPTEIYDNPNNISYFNLKDTEENRIQIVGDPRIKD
ncbi:MAG: VOC family protein [Candidatus Heimdallarchaeota archaeon]|nr:VOC family protein [Candidatus Heimdallarchaeota archaeon]